MFQKSVLFCVAVLLLGGLAGLTAFAKGKPPGGGGGPTPPGTVYFLDVDGAAYMSMDADGNNKTLAIDVLADPGDPGVHLSEVSYALHGGNRWFLQRRQIVYQRLELVARRAPDVTVVLWFDPDASVRQCRWAKDDSFVVFLVNDKISGLQHFHAADVDWSSGTPTLGPSTVLFETGGLGRQGWDISPDGEQLVYVTWAQPTSFLVRNLTTGATVDLGLDAVTGPRWSPDGTRIAFHRRTYSPSRKSLDYVYTVRPDGSDLIQVAPGLSPRWSPDGAHLAYTRLVKDGKGRNAPKRNEVLRTAATGGSEVNMTEDVSGDALAAGWR